MEFSQVATSKKHEKCMDAVIMMQRLLAELVQNSKLCVYLCGKCDDEKTEDEGYTT